MNIQNKSAMGTQSWIKNKQTNKLIDDIAW